VRSYLRGYLEAGTADRFVLRTGLKLIERCLRFTELPTGRKMAEKCGVDWSQVLPHSYLAASAQPEVVRLREMRVPGWLAHIAAYKRAVPGVDSHRRMLEILAAHAEPLCARPAAVRHRSGFRVPRSTFV
jgi:hypothetical protein